MPRSELPRDLGDAFLWRDARRRGVSRRRLEASDLSTEFRGARSRVPAPSTGDRYAERYRALLHRCRAYLPLAPGDFRFSHLTAARLYRIPVPWQLELRDALDVTVAGSNVPRRAGIAGHRTGELPAARFVEGLPVVPPETAWLQLATEIDVDELVVAGDYLVRRKRPLAALAGLQTAVAGSGRGVARARLALPDIREGTDSPTESRLRLAIVRAGLPEPVIGHAVYFEGHFVGTPDLAYVRERIALDFDGAVHREDERVYLDDVERRNLFADAGWRYITVTKENLRVPRSLLARLDRLLADP